MPVTRSCGGCGRGLAWSLWSDAHGTTTPRRFGSRAPSFSLNVEPSKEEFRFEATRSAAARQGGSFSCAGPLGSVRIRSPGEIVVLCLQTGSASAYGTRRSPGGGNQSAQQTPARSADLGNTRATELQAAGPGTVSKALDTGRLTGRLSSSVTTGMPAEDAAEREPASPVAEPGCWTMCRIFAVLAAGQQVHAIPKRPKPARYHSHGRGCRSVA